jgi:hypothetical protein
MKMKTTYQNLSDTAKAVLRKKFISLSAYIKNTERSQINDIMLNFKLVANKNMLNPKLAEREK